MSRKRSFLPEAYRSRKRICTASSSQQGTSQQEAWQEDESMENGVTENGLPSDTKAALLHLKNLFPTEKLNGRLPPIILQHQLYSIIQNKTTVDREVLDLRQSGEIKVLKLGTDALVSIIFTDDYIQHVRSVQRSSDARAHVIEKFLTDVVPNIHDVSVSKEIMFNRFKFKDSDITDLISVGVLSGRAEDSWWINVPNAGLFVNTVLRGRTALLKTVKKCKYKEILKSELETRKLPKVAKLGMEYYIHDIIGAELVHRISTTSGDLLRLQE